MSTNDNYELDRILDLEVVPDVDEEGIDLLTSCLIKSQARKEGFRLLPAQANMVAQFCEYGGVFGNAAAGAGKTLTCFIIQNLCLEGNYTAKANKVLHLCPSDLLRQLKSDIKSARTKIHFPNNVFHFADCKPIYQGKDEEGKRIMIQSGEERRLELAKSNARGIYVLGYGLLSGRGIEEVIHALQPDVITIDECQYLASPTAACTRRVMGYLKENPLCRIAAMSGTVIRKSIMNYHHLLVRAIHRHSPLPIDSWFARQLSEVLRNDAAKVLDTKVVHYMAPLWDWYREHQKPSNHFYNNRISEKVECLREAYKYRLATSPGTFVSEDGDIPGTSLYFDCIKTKPEENEGYKKLKLLSAQVEEEWMSPSGDEFSSALQKFKWQSELWQGFYNDLVWEDHPLLELAQKYHEACNEYNSAVRKFLTARHRPGLDTPWALGNDMMRNGPHNVGSEIYDLFNRKRALYRDDLPERKRIPVRVSDFKIQAAIKAWKKYCKGGPGLVWFYHNTYGEWLYEVFSNYFGRENVRYCPAGAKSDRFFNDKRNDDKICITAIGAHNKGKNLQHFHQNLLAETFHTTTIAEQSIARTHRNGQEAEELVFRILSCSKFDRYRLAGILNDALFIHSSHMKQRLLTGGWINTPEIFKSKELKEVGVEIENVLNEKQFKELKEKFE